MTELERARLEINRIDADMARLFEERMKASETIARYKKEYGLAVRDPIREAEVIDRNTQLLKDEASREYYIPFLKNTMELSCRYQNHIISGAEGTIAECEKFPGFSVHLGGEGYDILLYPGALSDAGNFFRLDRKVLLVTDSGVPEEYTERVASFCAHPVRVTLPAGEGSKTVQWLETLLHTMLGAGFTREDCVCAVGGGMVGDISGFAASVYMRGIDFYNVPTTLLSQIDSSVGGKTAIDYDGVKNAVGAFRQPKGVLVDPDLLASLEERQLHAGLAEAVKMAATSDASLFSLMETCTGLQEALPEIISRSLRVKISVVEEDPQETGVRRVLNFGHTVGHALEAFSCGTLLHGECVGLGMLPMCAPAVRERIRRVLKRFSLPTEADAAPEALLPYLLHDKKQTADGIVTVWVEEIGSYVFRRMTAEELLSEWEAAR